jgi:hypothetical protein
VVEADQKRNDGWLRDDVTLERRWMKTFNFPVDTIVITSKYVTRDRSPILQVTHDFNEEAGDDWQFHSGNGDYTMENMQLVRLSTILAIDPQIAEVADLPVDYVAFRESAGKPWSFQPK